MEATSDESTN